MLKPKQPLQSIRCQLVSNLCYLIPVHVLVPLPQGQYMESQLGLALVGPTSCTSCLCRKKNPSTFSGSGVKLSSAVQISAPTNVQSNMRTLSYRRSPRSQLFSQTNLNAFERIVGEVCISVHLELPRSLHDHYLSFLVSDVAFPGSHDTETWLVGDVSAHRPFLHSREKGAVQHKRVMSPNTLCC